MNRYRPFTKNTSEISLPQAQLYEILLFIAVLSGPPKLRERDPFASLSGQIDWSIMLSAAVWLMASLWVLNEFNGYVLVKRGLPSLEWLHKVALVFVFCLSLSIFVSPARLLTTYRIFQILVIVLFSALWTQKFGIQATLKHLTAGFVFLAGSIGLAALFAPALVYGGARLRGDLIANTGAVSTMGIILITSYSNAIKNVAILLSTLGLLMFLLIFSMTRSAYAAMFAFILLAVIRHPKSDRLRRLNYLLFALIPVIVVFQWTPAVLSWLIREKESIPTLSDRIPLWEYALSATFEQHPLIGNGFFAGRTVTTAYNPGLGTTHSAFIEILAGGGLLSFAIFGLFFIPSLFQVIVLFFRYGKQSEVFTIISLFISTVAFGFVSEEMIIASSTSFTFWMVLSLIPMVARHARDEETAPTQNQVRYESPDRSQPLPASGR